MPRPLAILALFVALLPAAADAAVEPRPARDEFHFIVLGDSQFHDPALFNRLVDDVRHLNPAFVVQVGDMIEGYAAAADVAAEWTRFKRQIAPLDVIPFVPVPGNHDLYNAQRRSDAELEAIYRSHWGPTYRSFDYRNGSFIILNSDAPGEERSIGPDQWRWLVEQLEATTAEHVFVFLHRPPSSLENAEALHDLLRKHQVRYVFYGHHHHYHFYERDGIRYVMTNAAAHSAVPYAAAGSYPHFLLVSIRDGDVRYAVVKADAIAAPESTHPDDNYPLFELIRQLVAPEQPLQPHGERSWSLQIPLRNPTARPLAAYLRCASDDARWRFDPAAIPVVELAPEASHTVSLTATYAVDGPPETQPRCVVQVPFQTRGGEWIPVERSTVGVLP